MSEVPHVQTGNHSTCPRRRRGRMSLRFVITLRRWKRDATAQPAPHPRNSKAQAPLSRCRLGNARCARGGGGGGSGGGYARCPASGWSWTSEVSGLEVGVHKLSAPQSPNELQPAPEALKPEYRCRGTDWETLDAFEEEEEEAVEESAQDVPPDGGTSLLITTRLGLTSNTTSFVATRLGLTNHLRSN